MTLIFLFAVAESKSSATANFFKPISHRMKRPFTLLTLLLFPFVLFTQTINDGNRDHIWLFGYDSYSMYEGFGRTVIDFNQSIPKIYREDRDMEFNVSCASICDTDGDLLFYTNGIYIANAEHGQMENGDEINSEVGTLSWPSGLPVPQGQVILPFLEAENKYILIHGAYKAIPIAGPVYSNLNYSIIDMGLDNGLGAVVEKNVEIVQDTFLQGKITATRHGNGRDWWVIAPEFNTNRYYTMLVTPDGLQDLGYQEVGLPVKGGLGQSVFSTDGSKYLRYDVFSIDQGSYLNFYDFDRCSGLLSNQLELHLTDSAGAGGVAVSQSSRFAYVSSHRFVYQFDLWATDIVSSQDTVAVADGFASPWPHSSRFFLCQLAPNGKIYINTPSGSNVLHVIHDPDKKGDACNVENHGIHLPSRNAFTMPNFPYFRLGPLGGSPCDTLGIDNVPIAKFRHEQNEPGDFLKVRFRDLSYYEPATWQWEFGDGTTSQDTSPVHTYQQAGAYTVCLVVGNSNGTSDAHCREVNVPFSPVPEAAFTFSVDNLTATFTDLSIGSPAAWMWDLGFGAAWSLVSDQHPVHTYTADGTYNVCLTVFDSIGQSTTACQEVTVMALPPEADFTVVLNGFEASFTDTSLNSPGSWFWDFGDGDTSSMQHPQHTFPENGSYAVCLTVANAIGADTLCREVTVLVNETLEGMGYGEVVVFPNPAGDVVQIIAEKEDWTQEAKVTLLDVVGRELMIQHLQLGGHILQLDGLPRGLYFYKIWEGEQLIKSGKLIKAED